MSRAPRTPLAALVSLVALAAAPAALHAQDVLAAAPRNYRVLTENAQVRVVEGTLRPGEREPLHTHAAGWYYVTQGGTMRVVGADGRASTWAPKTGESFWGDTEAPHTAENVGRTPLTYILVEVKRAVAPSASPSTQERR
jgi:beta-alanine degradation protein BauB